MKAKVVLPILSMVSGSVLYKKLNHHFDATCLVYNWCLRRLNEIGESNPVSFIVLEREVNTYLKPKSPWLNSVSCSFIAEIIKDALHDFNSFYVGDTNTINFRKNCRSFKCTDQCGIKSVWPEGVLLFFGGISVKVGCKLPLFEGKIISVEVGRKRNKGGRSYSYSTIVEVEDYVKKYSKKQLKAKKKGKSKHPSKHKNHGGGR